MGYKFINFARISDRSRQPGLAASFFRGRDMDSRQRIAEARGLEETPLSGRGLTVVPAVESCARHMEIS